MQLHKLLNRQNPCHTSLAAEAALEQAVNALARNDKTAVVVLEGGRIRGILTRTDVLGAFKHGRHTSSRKNTVAQLMTRDLVLCGPQTSVEHALDCMAQSNIEHLPVVENGRLLSVIHERNLTHCRITSLQAEMEQLREYIENLHNAIED